MCRSMGYRTRDTVARRNYQRSFLFKAAELPGSTQETGRVGKTEVTPTSLSRQASSLGFCRVERAVDQLAQAGREARGAVFTRREVVDFILDLVGYTPDRPLHERTLLEPSFGDGDFLLVAVKRLLAACDKPLFQFHEGEIAPCIRAVELHASSYETTRAKLHALLCDAGISSAAASKLVDTWLIRDDFLLAELPSSFDFVVGNPPYVRQELIPDVLLAEYRARYTTIFDRADIYVPFIERSLTHLSHGGKLGIICADRWMKNRYGGPLRKLISDQFRLQVYVDMVNTQSFRSDVMAYPAIFIIGRGEPGPTRFAHRPQINEPELTALADQLTGADAVRPDGLVKEVATVGRGAEPWILESSGQIALVRRLEQDFPTIENAGCKVGIGVATGADGAYIGPFEELDVEDDRKLPLVMTRDILTGEVCWRGLGIVNPFANGGGLVSLDEYPRLKRYLEARRDQIEGRHVARKSPKNWYRTIDRIHPDIAQNPKLLIPDIKGDAHVVYESGRLYPHHNLYFITSEEWNLHALQAVLLSGIARLFVATYSTQMRGGYLRFQAQYLRRIRLPERSTVSSSLMESLVAAGRSRDAGACHLAALELYNLDAQERAALSRGSAEREKGVWRAT